MPREAEREVRALLDLMRESQAATQYQVTLLGKLLHHAAIKLKILDSEVGDKELIKEVAVEQAKLRRE